MSSAVRTISFHRAESGRDKSALNSRPCGFGAIRNAQFCKDIGKMVLDGLGRNEQRIGDLFVTRSLRQQVQHLALALVQFVGLAPCRCVRSCPDSKRGQLVGDSGGQQGISTPCGADGGEQFVRSGILEQKAPRPRSPVRPSLSVRSETWSGSQRESRARRHAYRRSPCNPPPFGICQSIKTTSGRKIQRLINRLQVRLPPPRRLLYPGLFVAWPVCLAAPSRDRPRSARG